MLVTSLGKGSATTPFSISREWLMELLSVYKFRVIFIKTIWCPGFSYFVDYESVDGFSRPAVLRKRAFLRKARIVRPLLTFQSKI